MDQNCGNRKTHLHMPKKSIFLLGVLATGGGVIFGYDIGVVSGALSQLKNNFHLSCLKQEMVVSSMLLGALCGSLIGGFFIDKFGRKPSIIASSLLYLIGAVVLAIANNYGVIILGRLLLGFAMALAGASECVYVSELAPSKVRGSLVSLNELGITVGILLSYFINVAFANDIVNGWRYMFGLSGIGAFVMLGTIVFLPRSPRYLLTKHKNDQAKEALFLVRINATEDHKNAIEQEFSDMEKCIDTTEEAKCSVDDYCNKMLLYPVIVGAGLVIFQQSTGEPNVLFYANTILTGMGFQNHVVASLGAVGLGLAKVVATVLCLIFVDKLGRRIFLLMGCMLMTVTIFGLAMIAVDNKVEGRNICIDNDTSMQNTTVLNVTNSTPSSPSTNTALKWFSLALLMLFIAGYSIGFGPITWIILSEIFPVQLRGRLFSFATSMNWAVNLLVSATFLGFVKVTNGLAVPFTVSAILGVGSVAFVYFVVPETKGKSLEEISATLNKGIQCKTKLYACCCHLKPKGQMIPLITDTHDESL